VLSEGSLAAFGPREEVLKALQGQPPAAPPPPQRRAPPTITFTPLPP